MLKFSIRRFDELPSTNEWLAAQPCERIPEGTVILARRQTAGQGRQGRTWHTEPDASLAFSLLLKPKAEPCQAAFMPILAGLALSETLRGFGIHSMIKWPNDIWIGTRKTAGILCRLPSRANGRLHLIIGIGLNINQTYFPPELNDIATSMAIAAGTPVPPDEVLQRLLANLGQAYETWRQCGTAPLVERYPLHDALRSRPVTLLQGNQTIQGIADGINNDGTLRIQIPGSPPLNADSGEVHLLR